ncbi:Nucleosome assembly factor-2 [Coniochaeta hoffmannii]|uniref:Nucleosome assembly factor-2 n=1 Tax=Coniochaeta hoffmannii TaxID=91930 RepID=A0AA38RX08_9PEZI|nr:Nucleosome assembly factor-2 [Coniochaeta hoffmannii]
MAAALEDTGVTYEELQDLEAEFEDVEAELLRQQVKLNKPLYEKRSKLISRIPNFWPLVIEQAPPEIDEYIQPSDAALLLSSLTSLSVSHFEIENGGTGDPRSIAIRWEFSENDYFEDKVIEKKFWYRRAKDGWSGLVSEPVDIRWKKGKDLTNGLLGMVKRVWDEEQAAKGKDGKSEEVTEEQKALQKKIENTGISGLSFFAWFGYVGRRVSAEDSRLSIEQEAKKRELRAEDKTTEEADEEEDDGSQDEFEYEIFPDGNDLAVAISEDLWPDAITYFIHAQEQDTLSDDEFESDDEEAPELIEAGARTLEERPAKKRRT